MIKNAFPILFLISNPIITIINGTTIVATFAGANKQRATNATIAIKITIAIPVPSVFLWIEVQPQCGQKAASVETSCPHSGHLIIAIEQQPLSNLI